MKSYNYYAATFTTCTARRAQSQGVKTSRAYGYYVLIDPPITSGGKRAGCERVEAWCRTKAIASRHADQCREAQAKGYYGCKCGSNKQSRACCGLPYTPPAPAEAHAEKVTA